MLDAEIYRMWNDSYQVYGSPRITAELADQGIHADKKTVAKRMKILGIKGISPRMFTPFATQAAPSARSIPDLVNRDFDTGEINKVWLSDMTYLRTDQGWLYLCAVRDGCSRRVIGCAMDTSQTTDLVERALRMAYTLRGSVPDGVVFHADRGCQYISA